MTLSISSPAASVWIGSAWVEKAAAAEGGVLGVEVRGTVHGARVVALPFYKRS